VSLAAWVGVALIATMNTMVGRMLAGMFRLPGVAPPIRTRRVLVALALGTAGAVTVYVAQGPRLTVAQAIAVCTALLASARSADRDYTAPSNWEVPFNAQAAAIRAICHRHGWMFDSTGEAERLGRADGIRFDEQDFWELLQWHTREMREIRIASLRSGNLDYDALCAREIVTLVETWDGENGLIEFYAKRAYGEGVDRLDHAALEEARRLASGIRARPAGATPE
jgi:hypothetical protein